MRPLKFRPEIEDDLEQTRLWYEGRRDGLGDEFCDRVDDAFERIRRMATSFAIVFSDVRVVQVIQFPYAVFYRVEAERVEVIAVMHTSRDAEVWRSRVDEP